jgi:hypothetical protein
MNRANLIIRTGVGAAALLGAALAFFTFEITFAYPPARTVQTGYRGTGMDQVINPPTTTARARRRRSRTCACSAISASASSAA